MPNCNQNCDSCGKDLGTKGAELHTCPYSEDINGDYETLCNCCDDCQNKCNEEI